MSGKLKIMLATLTILTTLLSASCGKIIEKREDTDASNADSQATHENITIGSESESDTSAVDVSVVPEYTNPLTGLGISEELSHKRPVAVMINNIKDAMPQHGTSSADVIYECIVEGAQTRLMAVYLDYESVPVIGSVRSSREYYLDFAMNHDAVYVHAGGSDEAYRQIKKSGINNLDGVNMYVPDMFYRDKERLKTMSLEHTLMTTGEKIADGIEFKGYRSEADEDFVHPFKFVPYGEEAMPEGEGAKYVSVTYSDAHAPYYIYNEEKRVYERYQFGKEQIDKNTDEQLSFENIIILYCDTYNTGDSYGHYSVKATGEGNGVYITRGKSTSIKWKKPDRATPVSYYTEDGGELQVNRGKTMMQICTTSMKNGTIISAEIPE